MLETASSYAEHMLYLRNTLYGATPEVQQTPDRSTAGLVDVAGTLPVFRKDPQLNGVLPGDNL